MTEQNRTNYTKLGVLFCATSNLEQFELQGLDQMNQNLISAVVKYL